VQRRPNFNSSTAPTSDIDLGSPAKLTGPENFRMSILPSTRARTSRAPFIPFHCGATSSAADAPIRNERERIVAQTPATPLRIPKLAPPGSQLIHRAHVYLPVYQARSNLTQPYTFLTAVGRTTDLKRLQDATSPCPTKNQTLVCIEIPLHGSYRARPSSSDILR